MEKSMEIVHSFDGEPKLIEKIQLSDGSFDGDFFAKHELFDMSGKKLFEFESFKSQTEGSIKKSIVCFDDYFVIDSTKSHKLDGESRSHGYYRAYGYDSSLISAGSHEWNDEGEREVYMAKKYRFPAEAE